MSTRTSFANEAMLSEAVTVRSESPKAATTADVVGAGPLKSLTRSGVTPTLPAT